jgi:hypothetical protein
MGSFLEKLQDIGFGNKGGPYSRQKLSGSTNYANYARARAGEEGERGVSQALALASKDGSVISFEAMNEIAEKWGPWGVTLNGVMDQAKGLNQGIEDESTKKQLTAMFKQIGEKKKDGVQITERVFQEIAENAGAGPMALQRAQDYLMKNKDTMFKKSAGESVYTRPALGGNPVEVVPGTPTAPKETAEQKRLAGQKVAQENKKNAAALRIESDKTIATWKKENPNADTLSKNEKRIRDEQVTRMAMSIEDDPDGPGAKQQVTFYNDYAGKSTSVYLWKKTPRVFGKDKEKAIRVDLPVYNGKQLTARDVQTTLSENPGMTMEQFLKAVKAIE